MAPSHKVCALNIRKAIDADNWQSQPKEHPEHSIRSLDQSIAPWPQQIEKVCAILQIDLDHTWQKHCDISASLKGSGDSGDPRVDWALKWILRSLEPRGEEPNERSLHYKSWDLLYELMKRSSVARIAKTIRESKFVEIVHRTFAWMGDQSAAALGKEPGFSRMRDGVAASTESEEESRKRKRNEEHTKHAARKFPNGGIDMLFTSVCANFSHMNHLIKTGSESVGYAVEHLKHAVKFPPQAMADILGNAFYVANALVHCMSWLSWPATSDQSHVRFQWKESGFEPYLTPLIDIWDRSTSRSARSDPQDSHIAFRKSCSISALLLVHTCSQTQTAGTLFDKLRLLLINHVTLPYRQSVFERKKTAEIGEQNGEDAMIQELSAGLRRRRLTKSLRKSKYDQKTQDHKNDALLSILFTFGVESYPRHSAPLRQKENPWLETLLLDLIQVIEAMRIQGSFEDDKRAERRLTRYMLETCDNENVRLDTKVLQDLVRKASGLFDEGANPHLEWDLIGYSLSLDPDVFVITKVQEHDGSKKKLKSNEYLEALLTGLMKDVPEQPKVRNNIARYVVIGLMDGFLKARDLPRFLILWEKQSGKAIKWRKHLREERGPNSKQMISVWEDDQVLHEAVTRLQHLTSTQLKDAMGSLSDDLRNHKSFDSRIPQLIILEALVQSAQSEDQIDELSNSIVSLSANVIETLSAKGSSQSKDAWRCWRILAAIQQRLQPAPVKLGGDAGVEGRHIVDQALKMLSELPKWNFVVSPDSIGQVKSMKSKPVKTTIAAKADNDDHDQSQIPEGFANTITGYIVDPIVGNPSTTAIGIVSETENFAQQYIAFVLLISLHLSVPGPRKANHLINAVNYILDALEPLCQKVEIDVFGHFQYEQDELKSFTPGSSIPSIESLYIGCTLLVISEPLLLR